MVATRTRGLSLPQHVLPQAESILLHNYLPTTTSKHADLVAVLRSPERSRDGTSSTRSLEILRPCVVVQAEAECMVVGPVVGSRIRGEFSEEARWVSFSESG